MNCVTKPRSHNAYDCFRDDPSPVNAVRLARANFIAEFRGADNEFVDALSLAERLLECHELLVGGLETIACGADGPMTARGVLRHFRSNT